MNKVKQTGLNYLLSIGGIHLLQLNVPFRAWSMDVLLEHLCFFSEYSKLLGYLIILNCDFKKECVSEWLFAL